MGLVDLEWLGEGVGVVHGDSKVMGDGHENLCT